ncbi:PRC-barrel domain containing protein [Candidatus Bathyarchaeota archaeon]|nr:PRC-barrel domain containing protein [Candidatus Bathyarchaeota archaeon]
MRFSELIGKEVYCENMKIGKITNIIVDEEEWKITHFEIELKKEAAFEILGVKSTVKNILAISAVGPASKAMTKDGIDLQVAIGQLRIYLRPP